MELSENSPLEVEGSVALAPADQLAAKFVVEKNPRALDETQLAEAMKDLAFGRVFTDHMAHAHYRAGEGWSGHAVSAFAPISLSPAAVIFHYGQEVFEGIKAYRHQDGSVWTFRPGYNAARMRASARRLAMPEVSNEDFIGSLAALVRTDQRWVPTQAGASLYLRPFMIASEAFLGVDASATVDYYAIASPVGPYFKNGFSGVSIWVTRDYHRAGPGGTGAAKCGGNYAASLLPQQQAKEKGCQQVCFLDVSGKYVEELGGMNIFIVYRDGSVATPALTGTILEGGTRSAILRLLGEEGRTVSQRNIALDELVEQIRSGEVSEVFACGTAAVITPITRLAGDGFDEELTVGPVASATYEHLTAIQYGQAEDPYGWMYRLV